MKTKSLLFIALAAICFFAFENCGQDTTFSRAEFGENASSSAIVCGGIGSSDNCDVTTSPIQGQIYYLTSDQQEEFGTVGLDTYFNHGTLVNATVLLDQIFIPTESFTKGFPSTADGTPKYLEDDKGNLLIEYFALKLKTNLQLSSKQGAGLYQLALISDDGARVLRTDTGEKVVNGDGTHPSMLSCGSVVNLAAGEAIPLEIDYYQGPRVNIALTLMWRKVDSASAADLSDPLCGKSGNDLFFGANYDDYTNQSGYGQLVQRGWSVVPSENLSGVTN